VVKEIAACVQRLSAKFHRYLRETKHPRKSKKIRITVSRIRLIYTDFFELGLKGVEKR